MRLLRSASVSSFRVVFLLLVVCLFGSAAIGQPWSGSGTAEEPYLIYTPAQMNAIGAEPNDWDKHFRLMADIDLSAYTGTSFNIIGIYVVGDPGNKPFTGVFDGNGHTISNFTYTPTVGCIGIFGYIKGGAKIKDLGLINPNVDGGASVGSLVGLLAGGRITNCYAEGGSVSGRESVGGLVGDNSGTISNCYSSASVSAELHYVGGLAGYGGIITNSYSTGSVSGYSMVGGLVGVGGMIITNSYSTGSVSGGGWTGGLVGYGGVVTASFWDIETSGRATSEGGTGKTTAEMQDINTFLAAGWDFVGEYGPSDDWAMPTGGGYPILWWQLPENELPPLPTFSGGAGTESDPYLISNATDLNRIGHNPRLMAASPHFQLLSDIDLTGVDFFFIGSQGHPYSGVFNGNGHTISNFTCTSTATNNVGLFGCISGENAKVKDLGLIDLNIDAGARDYVGSLVGSLEGGTITGCYTQGGSVSGHLYVGGLVGDNIQGIITGCHSSGSVSGSGRYAESTGGLVGSSSGAITNCYSNASVSGTGSYAESTGGLVGKNEGTIRDCYSTGSVSGTGSYIGGLVGINYGGTISNCYSTGNVSGNRQVGGLAGADYGTITGCNSAGSVSGNLYVGGLVGDGYGIITNCDSIASVTGFDGYVGGLVGDNVTGEISQCRSLGSVSGPEKVGGLVGRLNGGTISNCYSTATVLGNDAVGGLVGTLWDGEISNCYSAGSVFGVSTVGGLLGYKETGGITDSFWDTETSGQVTSAGGKGKTTAEMQTLSTFIGWGGCGNEGVWTLDEGNDYPRLLWENQAGQIISAQLSDFVAGAGTEMSPYLIYTAEELNLIGLFACEFDKHFKLMADIDLSGYAGTSFNIISGPWPFTGVFDGNGHTISDFTSSGGLFRAVDGPNAEIRDLGLVNPDIDAGTGDYVGSLVGWVEDGTISGCYVDGGSVSGYSSVGGLVGSNGGTVANCYSTGSVTGDSSVGGLVGTLRDGEISKCYSAGSVSGESGVGGLLGYKEAGGITDSFWDTETSGQTTSAGGTGLITVLMQMAVVFTSYGWDFVGEAANGTEDFWDICEGTNYPKLAWQIPVLGDFGCPDGVDGIDLGVLCEQWLFEELSADVWPEGGDGIVNFHDWAVFAEGWQVTNDYEALADFAEQWLKTGASYLIADIAPAPAGDEIVNGLDFAALAEEWLN